MTRSWGFGFPTAKTLGSVLRFKDTLEDWENVLNSEIWELEEVEVELFPHLLLSYNELSPTLKRCFSYCAAFPKDTEIDVESLITQWMALGYLGLNGNVEGDWKVRGREYFDKLAMRSLFQGFKKGGDFSDKKIKSFTMHDIIHDFAQFLRKNGGVGAGLKIKTCRACSPLLVSHVKEYRSLFRYQELPPHLCDCLKSVRLLGLRDCGLLSIPKEMEKLIRLRWLDLGGNRFPDEDLKIVCKLYNLQFLWIGSCELEEIPEEIVDLIHLKHLDLSLNEDLKELPKSLCFLHELESLNIDFCRNLSRLPQGIANLVSLKHLYNTDTSSLMRFPRGLALLTSLRTLSDFLVGKDCSKLGWLKNLNTLGGSLILMIRISGDSEDEVVEDAREAEMRKKRHLQKLEIYFSEFVGGEVKEAAWMGLINALEPHQNLQHVGINNYGASKLPEWITSPLSQLRSIKLFHCRCVLSLPPLGELPFLESVEILGISKLQFLGREFLGITATAATTTTTTAEASSSSSSSSSYVSSSNAVGFPKLKRLKFFDCLEWNEWEDITAEEEDSTNVSLMPCLTELSINNCWKLAALPHRLLRKASSLKVLNISESIELQRVYKNKKGEAWKSISRHNPHLYLKGAHLYGPRYSYL